MDMQIKALTNIFIFNIEKCRGAFRRDLCSSSENLKYFKTIWVETEGESLRRSFKSIFKEALVSNIFLIC